MFDIITQIHRKIKERAAKERKSPKKKRDEHERKSSKSPNEPKHDKDKTAKRHHKLKGIGSKKNCQSLKNNFFIDVTCF